MHRQYQLIFVFILSLLISCDQKRTSTNPPEIVERDSDTVFNDIPGEHHLGKEAFNYGLMEVLENIRKDTRFAKAIRDYGLTDSLKGDRSYTLFVPVDRAFENNGKGENISKEIIQGHIVEGIVRREDMRSGITVKTLAGTQLNLKIEDDVIIINNKTKVSAEDIQAENGVIHEVEEVLSSGSGIE